MSTHFPECLNSGGSCCPWMGDCTCQCICAALRDCEERVRNQDIATHHADLKEAKALLASRDEAWFAGVDAAREAIEAVDPPSESYDDWYPKGKRLALDAIEALRRKENDEAG